MKLKLVSFTLATLLKEIGFDIEVINFYDQNKEISWSTYRENINWNDGELRAHAYSSPTLELARQWFIDKHKLYAQVIPTSEGTWANYIVNIGNKKITVDPYERIDFDTHDESLEYTLTRACKLIFINNIIRHSFNK